VRLVVLTILVSAVLLPGSAAGKADPGTLLVCGQHACREDRGAAWRQASAIQLQRAPDPDRVGAFYDIAFIGESGTPGIALRYVPALRLTRVSRSGRALWFRASLALARELQQLTDGLAPRPARALDSPPGLPIAYRPPTNTDATDPAGQSNDPEGWLLLGGVGAILVLAAASAVIARRRPRPPVGGAT
jgi:hypothetical protein